MFGKKKKAATQQDMSQDGVRKQNVGLVEKALGIGNLASSIHNHDRIDEAMKRIADGNYTGALEKLGLSINIRNEEALKSIHEQIQFPPK
jgi:hypothetical protein